MHLAVCFYASFATVILIDRCIVHGSTALALIMPATKTSAPLSQKAFVAIWLLPCIVTANLIHRHFGRVIQFIDSQSSINLICIFQHPHCFVYLCNYPSFTPLLHIYSRNLYSPFYYSMSCTASTGAFGIVLDRFLHPLLWFCTASTEDFGVVLAIALLLSQKPTATSWRK